MAAAAFTRCCRSVSRPQQHGDQGGAPSSFFLTCQGVEGIGARAPSDPRPTAGGGADSTQEHAAARPARRAANHRGLLRWQRPVVQDPAGGFVSAAADRHAFPGWAAGRRDRGRRRRSSRPGDGGAGFDQELIAGPDRPVPGSALEDNPLARNGLPSFDQVLIAAPRTGPRRDGP